MEREKRRHRWFDRVTKRMRDRGSARVPGAARRQEQTVAGQRTAVVQFEIETGVRIDARAFDAFAGEKLYTRGPGFCDQTFDDRLR